MSEIPEVNAVAAAATAQFTRDGHHLNLVRFQNSFTDFSNLIARNASELRSGNENAQNIEPTKEHQKTALQFLSKQTQRLTEIEKQLLFLTDQTLLSDKIVCNGKNNRRRISSSNRYGSGSGNGNGNQNGNADDGQNVMSMSELSNLCRMLHSHHAKYLIQLEEILTGYGYVPKKLREEEQEYQNQNQHPCRSHDDDENNKENIISGEKSISCEIANKIMPNTGDDSRYTTPLNMIHGDNNIIRVSSLIGQPLNRLSEGEIETDVGSCITYGGYNSNNNTPSNTTVATHTPTGSLASASATASTVGDGGRRSSLISTNNIEVLDYDRSPRESGKSRNGHSSFDTDCGNSDRCEEDCTEMKTLSLAMASLKSPSTQKKTVIAGELIEDYNRSALSEDMVDKDIIGENTNSSRSYSFKCETQISSDESELMDETKIKSYSLSVSQEYNKIQDECLNLLDSANQSQNTSFDLMCDGTMSIASTVVCDRKQKNFQTDTNVSELNDNPNLNRVNRELSSKEESEGNGSSMEDNTPNEFKKMANGDLSTEDNMYKELEEVIEQSMKYMSASSCNGSNTTEEEVNYGCDKFEHAQADKSKLSLYSQSHISPGDVVDATEGRRDNFLSSQGNKNLDSISKALHDSCLDNVGSFQQQEDLVTSPLDRFQVQLLNGGAKVKVVSCTAPTQPKLSDTLSREKNASSPLDKFQVQVLNGGTEIKVSPIENDVLTTGQSPIMKMNSPYAQHNVSNREYNSSQLDIGIATNDHFVSPPIKSKKVYARTPMPKREEMMHSSSLLSSSIEESKVDSTYRYSETRLGTSASFSHNAVPLVEETFHDNSDSSHLSTRNQFLGNEHFDVVIRDDLDSKTPGPNFSNGSKEHLVGESKDQYKTPAPKTEKGATVRTPLATAWIKKHISEDKERLLKVLSSGTKTKPKSPSLSTMPCKSSSTPPLKASNEETTIESASSKKEEAHQHLDTHEKKNLQCMNREQSLIAKISSHEYDSSPRVVQIQVAFDELNRAVSVLEEWIVNQEHSSNLEQAFKIEEKGAYELLGKVFDCRKAKSLLMSLCLFGRISLQLPLSSDEGKFFVISVRKRKELRA